mmetsp:Transcript_68442/g.198478  ORF Transcript_68442/g.198478 Transcript_68442/m.198478 type:complete len:243 (-) Transcript_68442:392-1120(-)
MMTVAVMAVASCRKRGRRTSNGDGGLHAPGEEVHGHQADDLAVGLAEQLHLVLARKPDPLRVQALRQLDPEPLQLQPLPAVKCDGLGVLTHAGQRVDKVTVSMPLRFVHRGDAVAQKPRAHRADDSGKHDTLGQPRRDRLEESGVEVQVDRGLQHLQRQHDGQHREGPNVVGDALVGQPIRAIAAARCMRCCCAALLFTVLGRSFWTRVGQSMRAPRPVGQALRFDEGGQEVAGQMLRPQLT